MELVGEFMNEEILIVLLKRLRVKSLLRFMCVSKVWCNLITDPYFVASHLQFHKKSSSPDLQVLLGSNGKDLDYFRLTKTPKTVSEHLKLQFPWTSIPKLKQLELGPRKFTQLNVSILGHCNGVLCVREKLWYPASLSQVNRLIICNPVTRIFQILPETDIDQTLRNKKREAVSFGLLDDLAYKVVRVIYDRESIFEEKIYERPWAEVYDSRYGSWRRVFVEVDLSYNRVISDGLYNPLDGCLYWLGRGFGKKKNCRTFVSFDLVEEKWHEILLPKEIVNRDLSNFVSERVEIMGEYVVVCVREYLCNLRVWKMEKEGDKVRWTLMHDLTTKELPKGFCRDGKHLLMTRGWRLLVLHDSENMEDTGFRFADHAYNVVSDFVESLLLLDGESEEDFGELSNLFDENLQIQNIYV